MNFRWCSKAKAMISRLLNWVSTAVFLHHHGKNQASLSYEQAKSPAVFSTLSTANFKNQETLKSAACLEPLYPVCIAKINRSNGPKPRDLTNNSESKESNSSSVMERGER